MLNAKSFCQDVRRLVQDARKANSALPYAGPRPNAQPFLGSLGKSPVGARKYIAWGLVWRSNVLMPRSLSPLMPNALHS